MERKRPFIIYRITSPSGKSYTGLTGQPLKHRWQQHVKKAGTGFKHPLASAIRKYGAESFAVEHIASSIGGLEYAKECEILCIAQIPEGQRYNLSLGGEHDNGAGNKRFWAFMKNNPDKMEIYRARLVQAQKDRPPPSEADKQALKAAAKQWAFDNAREAYKIRHRASRIALRKAQAHNGGKISRKEENRLIYLARPLKERLQIKYKRARPRSSDATKKIWAGRTEEEKQIINAKIAETLKARYKADKKMGAANKEQLKAARKTIDRGKQGKAASIGQVKFWEELRKDPERLKKYMETRTASLRRFIESRKCR